MNEERKYPTATELGPPSMFEGDYKKVSELLGQRILVQSIQDWRSRGKYDENAGPTLVVNGLLEDRTEVFFFVSHDVLYHKFKWLADKTPFVAIIFQPEGVRYYDVK